MAISLALVGIFLFSSDSQLDSALATIRAVGKEAKGSKEATAAWKVAANAQASDLIKLLAAFDGANPLAVNYLSSAVDAVVAKRSGEIEAKALLDFLHETKNDPKARRLAFEIVTEKDPKQKPTLLAGMMNDPSLELRRDAIELVLSKATKAAEAKDEKTAKQEFSKALSFARDNDQITKSITNLRKLGEPIDVSRHLGFLMSWKIIGPFENKDGVGWPKAYPPEKSLDFSAEYDGKVGKVKWTEFTTDEDMGEVDLNAYFKTRHKGAVAYCYTEFVSPNDRDAELRLGCVTAWKIFVNGKLVFERNESHAGYSLDQYTIPVHFKSGKNEILLKVCQNEMTQAWAQDWKFRLRVCDSLGTALLSEDRPPARPTLGNPAVAPKAEAPSEAKPNSKK